jgi:DNA-binding transcriptional MocR family regulator
MRNDNPPAARIAMDLATVIFDGTLGEDQEVPSQTELMKAYGVAMGTAAAALARVRDAGLIQTTPGCRSTVLPRRSWPGDVGVLYEAGDLCRSVASTSYGISPPTYGIGFYYDHHWDEEVPAREVDVEVLTHLDRTVVRAMGEQLRRAARRIVGHGPQAGDDRLVEAAQALLRDGGRRPDNQPGIAWSPRWPGDGDHAARRLWPDRYLDGDPSVVWEDQPPF